MGNLSPLPCLPIFLVCQRQWKENLWFSISNGNWNATKDPPKSLKNEMLVFGLPSTSDDWLSNPSNESWPKCKKVPLSHWKMKCSFLDYLQLLMISWAIWVMKVDWNAKKKKGCKIVKKWNAHLWITFNFWWLAKWSEWQRSPEIWKKWPPNHQKMKQMRYFL